MKTDEKAQMEHELDGLYTLLQKQALNLNQWLTQAHRAAKAPGSRTKAWLAEVPDPLSEEFTELLIRYKQLQKHFMQLTDSPEEGCIQPL